MGKLNIVVQDVPQRKHAEEYEQVVEAFNALPLGKAFVIQHADIPSSSLAAKIRDLVTVDAGVTVRVSFIKDNDGKTTGVRLAKVRAPKKKQTSDSEGETQAFI